MFNAPHVDIEDKRIDYGEKRIITFGFLADREVVIVWTQRDDKHRIISMRKVNEREQKEFYKYLG